MSSSSSPPILHIASSVFDSLPKFTFDAQFMRTQMETGVPSMLFTITNNEQLTLTIPGVKQTETEQGVWVSIEAPIGQQGYAFEGFNFYFLHKTPHIIYHAAIKVPHMFDPHADLIFKYVNGVSSVCLPTQKTVDPFIAQANINRTLTRPTPYCEMFNRAELGRRLCEVIAHPGVKSKSFTAHKKDSVEGIYFKGNMPGVEKMIVTKKGLCVWLSMPGFELEDVEVGFEFGALIVEGKREGEHYIAGVRVPERFCRENDVIKKGMQDGVFKAILPHAGR